MGNAPPHKSDSNVRMEKLKLREGQPPAPGHTAKQGQSFTTTTIPASGFLNTTTGPRLPSSRRAENN